MCLCFFKNKKISEDISSYLPPPYCQININKELFQKIDNKFETDNPPPYYQSDISNTKLSLSEVKDKLDFIKNNKKGVLAIIDHITYIHFLMNNSENYNEFIVVGFYIKENEKAYSKIKIEFEDNGNKIDYIIDKPTFFVINKKIIIKTNIDTTNLVVHDNNKNSIFKAIWLANNRYLSSATHYLLNDNQITNLDSLIKFMNLFK